MDRVRAALIVSVLITSSFACSSSTDPGGKRSPFEPLISVQTIEVPRARPSAAREFTTVLTIAITNPTSEPVTLERIDVESVGVGPFILAQSSSTYNQVLDASQSGTYQVFARATVDRSEEVIARSEGTVIIRAAAHFRTSAGHLRKVIVQRVGTTVGTGSE